MEHLIRIVNEADRLNLAWLYHHVGAVRLERAARELGHGRKPYLSAVCRRLGVWPPPVASAVAVDGEQIHHEVGDLYLAQIRRHLSQSHAPSKKIH